MLGEETWTGIHLLCPKFEVKVKKSSFWDSEICYPLDFESPWLGPEKFFWGRATGPQSRVGSKFQNLKILIFLLWPQILGTKDGFQSEFPHPAPRIGCQFSYAKEMRWIGPKMTEWEPFSWRRSKFLKMSNFDRIAIFDVFAEILISTVWAQFWGYWPQSFLYWSIIAYILRWYPVWTSNPDF